MHGTVGSVLHGGNLAAAAARFPAAPQPWIDLSTGINPHAYTLGAFHESAWQRLPEAAALRSLEDAAAAAYQAGPQTQVAAASGTQALIQVLPRVLPGRRVTVLGFGYQEHPEAWRAAGCEVRVVETLEEAADADVAVVVNPNNPDGRLTHPDALIGLASRLAEGGGTLVVDEAFMDCLEPASSLVPRLPAAGAVVLRSFGKMFGLAGLRLGFAIGGPGVIAEIGAALGPWPVSGPAIAIGARALADVVWQQHMRGVLRAEAGRLDRLLLGAGFAIAGGTPLFRLASHSAAGTWYERLGDAGILVRPFPSRPHWLRFGLPGDEPAWRRLELVLR